MYDSVGSEIKNTYFGKSFGKTKNIVYRFVLSVQGNISVGLKNVPQKHFPLRTSVLFKERGKSCMHLAMLCIGTMVVKPC